MSDPAAAVDLETGGPQAADGLRAQIVEATIDLFRVRSFNEVTLDDVARSSAVPVAEVRQRFATFGELVLEVIRAWNDRRMAPIVPVASEQGAVAFLRRIVIANVADPALMRLLSAVAHIGATPGHPMAPVLQSEWIRFHALVQRALSHDAAVGREPGTMEPARGAEQLIALYEGLQLQSMLRPNMDVVEAFDRAVTRLRHGWSEAYRAPVWTV